MSKIQNPNSVTPAKAGAQNIMKWLDSDFPDCVVIGKTAHMGVLSFRV